MSRFTTPICASALAFAAFAAHADVVTMGQRPYYLIDRMKDGELKDKLLACAEGPFSKTDFSIGHRGAQMMFPEHTVEANVAAARQGAGILECDVTFTKDKELVCRHAQNDLQTTTNILASDLADTCVQPFTPATETDDAKAECRTSELTLSEFKTLTPKMDAGDDTAETVEAYMDSTAPWRTDLYAVEDTTLMSHKESIALFKSLGAKFTPELKAPAVQMPFEGFTQEDYAQKLVDEYKEAGIPASDVFLQSFNIDDVLYWIKAEPEFGAQAVYLVEGDETWSGQDPQTWEYEPQEIADMDINYLAPALWMMVTLQDGEIVPSEYARQAKEAGLELIAWSLERSGPLVDGGGWYYQSVAEAIDSDGMMYPLVDVLAQDVGVAGIFSDWPATVTYYDNCMSRD